MLLKVALMAVLGSIGLIALARLTDGDAAYDTGREEERLERAVTAQLQNLREHLFSR